MLEGSVSGLDSLDRLIEKLREAQAIDLTILGEKIADIVIEGNREGLLAGLDADGKPMAPLKPSTIKRGRSGDGPPTVPRRASSGLIAGFKPRITREGSIVRVRVAWEGAPQVRYFKAGTRNMVARNPVGIRPATREEIDEAVRQFRRDRERQFYE